MIRFDGLPPEVMQAMCTPMHLIIPGSPPNPSRPATGALYLGSLSATMEKSVLHEHNITHLVQVLDVPWLPLTEKDGFECYRIDILDVPSADLKGHLEGACKDIDKALRGGKNILVHCQQGVSRSAAIVIAYLIKYHGMSYDSAHAFVKRKRPCIKPNTGFVEALRAWEGQWRPPAIRRNTT